MADDLLEIEKILGLLKEGPGHIAALTAGTTPEQLRSAPTPGEWSAVEILAHVRSCGDVWGTAITKMLSDDHPTIRAVNPRAWIKRTDYCELEFSASLIAYTHQRAELLNVLEQLTPEQWVRAATVTGAGKPLQRTVFFYAHWLATHERTHLKQFARTAEAVRGRGL